MYVKCLVGQLEIRTRYDENRLQPARYGPPPQKGAGQKLAFARTESSFKAQEYKGLALCPAVVEV